jgi:RNA polymerase sigma factor (sigma-70 family)
MRAIADASVPPRSAAIRNGGSDFERFFRGAYPDLVRALAATTRDVAAAEDLVQEAMARVYTRWSRVASMQSPAGYVYVIAANLHRRQLRRAKLLRTFHLPEPFEDPMPVATTRTDLLAAVARLPPGQRDALLMVEWLGIDVSTASRLLRIKPSSVRARTHRARATLQHQLER